MMKRVIMLLGFATAIVLGLVIIDVLKSDEPFTWPIFLLDLLEKTLLAIGMAATAIIALEIRGLKRERSGLLDDLARARAEGERWRAQVRQHVEGLSKAISMQFAAWRLSAGEAEVAALLLKGLSHKEIAGLRETSEATVRQQAAAVYRKSGLGSRAELAAFFLEDLLAPMDDMSVKPSNGLTVVRER
jgi:DNA-binding CsgD family transcriptional regulator